MTILGELFDKPLHVASWSRPKLPLPSKNDYRVTNPYYGPDLINGGLHLATDVGNARANDPVHAPLTCRAKGLRNGLDGALGIRYELGADLFLDLWHLNRVDVGDWTEVRLGQVVGLTGNTGAQPMPAHTHIELWQSGIRIDAEPYLPMVEKPAIPLPEESMQIKGEFVRHVINRQARVTVNSSYREGPSTSDTRIEILDQGALFLPTVEVKGQKVGTATDADRWFYGVKTAGVAGTQMGCVHSSVLPRTKDGQGVALEPIESGFSQADMDAARTQGRAEMKRDCELAVQRVTV